MPRTGTRRKRRRTVRNQPEAFRIHAIDDHRVQPQIGHQREPAAGVKTGPVRMRRILPPSHDSRPATVFDQLDPTSHRTVGRQFEHAHRPATILRAQQQWCRRMHRQVCGAAVADGNRAHQPQALVRPDFERRDARFAIAAA